MKIYLPSHEKPACWLAGCPASQEGSTILMRAW
jgi:hypothetical protein